MAQKTYRVAGKHAVLGHAPGKTFSSDLDEKTEGRLLRSGALEVVTPRVTETTKRAPEPAPDNNKE